MLLASGAGLALALAAALSVASLTGVDIAGAAAAKAQSFLDLMRQRSPGERTSAQLTKIKRKHRVLAERALPEIPALAPYIPPVQLFAPAVQSPLVLTPGTLPIFAEEKPPLPSYFTPPPGGVIFAPPPGGGGGPPGGGPGGPPQQPPPPPQQPPAVPEPGTWAMMIVGFGLSGWMLRRRREEDRRVAI